jgi:hypothetical protein
MKKSSLKHCRLLITLLVGFLLTACGGEEYEGFDASVTSDTPDAYLNFFNSQGELAAGEYRLVVATATAGQSGNFSVQISRNDDSTDEVMIGEWSDSAGPSTSPATTCSSTPANVCFTIDMQNSAGLNVELTSTSDGILYLIDDSDSPVILAEANVNGAVANGISESLSFSKSIIDETSFAEAYYAAVDPEDARDTLQGYQRVHGFDVEGADVHVIFRDSKDLGYGRDMYMRSYPNPSDCGGHVVAFYVRNFSVKIIDGFAYGPVNLEGAINEDLQHHFGSNAIEFSHGISTEGDTCSPEPMAKFYTYLADYSSADADHPRRLRIDLDNRGEKAMPQPCISCHGGKLRPLDRFGRFVAMHANDPIAQIGDTNSQLQAFEIDTFEFSDEAGHTRADYEEGLRKLNAAIYCTYPGSLGHAACDDHGGGLAVQADEGEWSGDFGREVLLGWYGNALETPGSSYDGEFVPEGWRPAAGGPPGGADALFQKVVGPNCFVCHGKRGTQLGSNTNAGGDGKDLDFSTWDKFISHATEIERLVFNEGRMPLGLLNYDNFWDDPEKPTLLASFIVPYLDDPDNFKSRHVSSDGSIKLPGQILVRAGLDRVTRENAAITLNASHSLFADRFNWSILSAPDDAIANFSSTVNARTDFSTDTEGEYLILLAGSNSDNGQSGNDELTIVVDNSVVAPRSLSFYTDVTTELNNCATSCHSIGGGVQNAVGIPVWWVDDISQPLGLPASESDYPSLGLYEKVMARVNLANIEDSLILKKPSNTHHYGGLRPGFDASNPVGTSQRRAFDLFTNWISEGAVCGGTTIQCP